MEYMFMEKGERKSERRPVLENTTYKLLPATSDKVFDGVITDISESGACLLTTSHLNEGQIILIGDNQFFLEKSAIVIWSQKIGDMLYKIGLEYKENIVSLNLAGIKSTETAPLKKELQANDKEQIVLNNKEHVPFHSKKTTYSKTKILPVFILVALITLTIGGILLYKNTDKQTKTHPLPSIKTTKTVKNTDKTILMPPDQAPQQIPVVKKPAPQRSPEIKSVAKKTVSIQVGAFHNEENAKRASQIYKDKGHEVFIDKITTKEKGIMYKVLIGQFENKKEASQFAKDIQSKENIDVMIKDR